MREEVIFERKPSVAKIPDEMSQVSQYGTY